MTLRKKSVFLLAQQKFAVAMIVNNKLVECRKFLNGEWKEEHQTI